MKEKNLQDKEESSKEVFKLLLGSYPFAPKQMVMVDLNNGGKQFPGIIENLKFSERQGGPTPLADITIFAWWNDGTPSGGIKIELVPHRYCTPMTGESMINSFSDYPENERLFTINKEGELVFPFSSKK